MNPSLRRLWAASLALVLTLGLGACASPQPASERPTHALDTVQYTYAGYLVPRDRQKVGLSKSQLGVRAGDVVTEGQSLGNKDAATSARAKQRTATAYRERAAVARRALQTLRGGSFPLSFRRAPSLADTAVRATELEIEAALIAHRRAEAQYRRDIAQAKGDKATTSFLRADKLLATAETRSRLQGLFENLASQAGAAATAIAKRASAQRVTASFDGTVTAVDGTVWILSRQASLIYLATQEQVDAITGAKEPRLLVRGLEVGSLRLTSVIYSDEATTSDSSPRYEMTFEVVAEETFAPREHSSASLTYRTDDLAVPDGYLGRDTDGYFVLREGQRVSVQVEKDAQGQFILRTGDLRAGDRIERVDAAS